MDSTAKNYFQKSWDSIKIVFSTGVTFIKKGWVIFTLSTALAGAAGYIWWQSHQQEKAQEEITQLQEQAIKLEEKTNELIKLNQENQKVYEQLAQDRLKTEQLISGFNAQMTANAKVFSSLSKNLGKLEDGQVAPVLKETIRSIQKMRDNNEK